MRWKPILTAVVSLIILVATGRLAFAQSSSSNYKIEESFIGPGGQLDSSSAGFKARASLGDTGINYSDSSNFSLWAGYTTNTDPFIEFSVNTSTVDLGVLSTTSASTATATFNVKAYLSSGYVVTTYSPPPKNNSVTINALTTPTASAAGTEQFGINLVANTLPEVVGNDPVQTPTGTPPFGFGYAAAGYNTPNAYKYVDGDVVAQSDSSSGQTDYTITYIFNISNITPGGEYVMNHALIATATF